MPDWRSEVRRAIADLKLDAGREEGMVEELAQGLSERYEEMLRSGMAEKQAVWLLKTDLEDGRLIAELRRVHSPASELIPPGVDNGEGLFAGWTKDVRLGLRLLRMSPGFAIVAILSLALGIGANTAIFELLDAVLLKTLPVAAPEQLATIHMYHDGRIGETVTRQREFSYAIWEQLKERQEPFSDVSAWSTEPFDLGNGGEARNVDGIWADGNFFRVLQIQPVLGRLISAADDYRGCGVQGVVISYGFWQREYGGRTDVVGKRLSLDQKPFEIIGVTPASFTGLEVGRNFDVAVPMCSEPAVQGEHSWTDSHITWWLSAIGRLKPGWNIKRASAQLASIAPQVMIATMPSEYDADARGKYLRFSFGALPAATGVSSLRDEYERPLFLLLAISGLVLLIACANLANLMLARASTRQREMALRIALGASPRRLVRQMLLEGLLLAVIGAGVGIFLAQALSRGLVAFISSFGDTAFLSLTLDSRVLLFTMGLAVVTCLLFAMAPALQAARSDPGTMMKGGGRNVTTGRESLLLRRSLIIGQVALSMVLLVAALLFVRTFRNLVRLNAGFQQDNLLVADFDFSNLKIPAERRLEYKHELWANVGTTPGVAMAAETEIVPLTGSGWNEFINIPEIEVHRKLMNFNAVGPGYFRTMEIPLFAGRDFDENDTLSAPLVAIVNEKCAHAFFGNSDPIGRTFRRGTGASKLEKVYQIVGLVGDTKYRDLREDFSPIIFLAESQNESDEQDSTMMVRSSEPVSTVLSALKESASRMSPEIVLNFWPLRTAVLHGLGRERLMAMLSGFYGALAALLATVGIYGIISYMAVRRKNEIGIRMAMGASKSNILAMILREGLGLVAIGLASGTILAVIGGRAAGTMLFGVKPADPITLAVAIGGLTLVAVAASLLPAVRATGVQPVEVLREE
jgi:putative ABC transport system permease protein